MAELDALIIGGGHNGLVCACYLAAAGKKVCVLERREIIGGAAVTEEFHPGFRNSVASYTVSLLHPKVIRDLRLEEHGLKILDRPLANFLPLSDSSYLKVGGGLEATRKEFARFSPQDADRLSAYYEALETVADVLRDMLLVTPPNVGGGIGDIVHAIQISRRFKVLSMEQRRFVLDMFTKSAAEVLDQWFENAHIKAVFGFDAVVGNFASPHTPGSAYVLLHHVFGEVNGKKGNWGHAVGGMGAITQAMGKQAMALGVEIRTDAEVRRVLVEGNAAVGVELTDGAVRAKTIVSNLNPRLLYGQLISSRDLPEDFNRAIKGYRCGSGTLRMNVALSELPRFTCLPEEGIHHQAGIIMAPTMEYMDRAYADARARGWSDRPIVEMLIPSTVDDSLAPAGMHVASLFCQHFSPELPEGRSWDECKDAAVRAVIETVDRHAPNFSASIEGMVALTPLDLERKFGLIGGDIFHGSLGMDQLFSARPVLGHGNYRGPLKNLYMCGSGTHPGGGVTGVPGHNAAREILKDARRLF